MTARFSLLDEPIFSVRTRDGTVGMDLPGILASLARDELDDFAALRPHQHHAWHAFLVQLGAMALDLARATDPPTDRGRWRTLLVELAGGVEEAFALVVDDVSKPAFFQPPVPEGKLAGVLKHGLVTPDELDVLLTAKNHDLKMSRMDHGAAEQWAYALISVQTTQGYSGPGYYGVIRMNGGYGSRSCLALLPNQRWGARFNRELRIALDERPALIDAHGYAATGGHGLLWTLPWDGTAPLSMTALDPFFLEVCRRVRFTTDGFNGIRALQAQTKKPRVDGGDSNGRTGDLWTPIDREAGKALSITEAGFGYRKAYDLLFGSAWERPPAGRFDGGGAYSSVLLQALARGQGQTNGYHERRIPVPKRARRLLSVASDRDHLAELGKERLQMAKEAENRALFPAILAFLNGGRTSSGGGRRDSRPGRWLDRMDAQVDALYFPRLFKDVDRDDEEAQRDWALTLRDLARSELEDVFRSAPTRAARRWQAIALAESVFEGSFRKHFAGYLTPQEETPDE